MQDAVLQVAPDSTGKQVDMDLVATASGSTIYRQRAEIVGFTREQFDTIMRTETEILKTLRAIFYSLNSPNSNTSIDDFNGDI